MHILNLLTLVISYISFVESAKKRHGKGRRQRRGNLGNARPKKPKPVPKPGVKKPKPDYDNPVSDDEPEPLLKPDDDKPMGGSPKANVDPKSFINYDFEKMISRKKFKEGWSHFKNYFDYLNNNVFEKMDSDTQKQVNEVLAVKDIYIKNFKKFYEVSLKDVNEGKTVKEYEINVSLFNMVYGTGSTEGWIVYLIYGGIFIVTGVSAFFISKNIFTK